MKSDSWSTATEYINIMITVRAILTALFIGTTSIPLAQNAGTDTAFIFKNKAEAQFQSIFIDNNKGSKFYGGITNFTLSYSDNESYQSSIDFLRQQHLAFQKVKPVIPWTDWVALKQYNGQFYAYYPCDFSFHFRQSVNDTTFIDWTGEGPVANKINGQKRPATKLMCLD